MTPPTSQGPLEIDVTDFGPIVRAKVELRPMTVFIGPSNTGKSYLAILLYALHRLFSNLSGSFSGFGRFEPMDHWNDRSATSYISKEAIADFDQFMQAVADVDVRNAESTINIPDRIAEVLRYNSSRLGQAISSEILRCFGLDKVTPLIRKGRSNRACVVIRNGFANGGTFSEHSLVLSHRDKDFQTTIPTQISVSPESIYRTEIALDIQRVRRRFANATDESRLFGHSIDRFIGVLLSDMVGDLSLPGFYLPADRTGVMHAHSVVVSATLANVPMAGLQPTARAPLLSGVLTDFLRELIYIDHMPGTRPSTRRRSHKYDPGSEIENHILRGAVGIERSQFISYPQFTYRPDGWKEDLPLLQASSMVSDLAPVVLYLRYLVQPGNVLIIEEPESHLHPAMQVELTRQLAKLVQAGYRVIITTHSEWILEELANVVQRSQLRPEERSTISDSDAALTSDQVGVWLFRQKIRPKGSEVVHVPLGDSGLYDSGFDDVAITLSNDGANIFNRIVQSK